MVPFPVFITQWVHEWNAFHRHLSRHDHVCDNHWKQKCSFARWKEPLGEGVSVEFGCVTQLVWVSDVNSDCRQTGIIPRKDTSADWMSGHPPRQSPTTWLGSHLDRRRLAWTVDLALANQTTRTRWLLDPLTPVTGVPSRSGLNRFYLHYPPQFPGHSLFGSAIGCQADSQPMVMAHLW